MLEKLERKDKRRGAKGMQLQLLTIANIGLNEVELGHRLLGRVGGGQGRGMEGARGVLISLACLLGSTCLQHA